MKSSDTIYISRELLHADPAQAQRILMEEMGHGLDARLNTSDAAGDEGEIFSKLMHGDKIDATQMAALKVDNDHGVVMINGQAVTVEYGFLSKLGKAITGGIKKVAGAVTKGVVNLAKSAVTVATGLVTMDFDKVKDGFKDGVNAVKTSVKAVHNAVVDTAKEIHRITKQAFQKLMQSKLFATVLAICRFIPIPVVQLVVHIVDAVRAAYMVYQGIKHKSLGMVLGGVASLVSGAGNAAGALGASTTTVGTISSVANAASKLSMAYNAVANKDMGAALGLLGGVSGVQGTALGAAAGYVQQGLGIRQAVRSGDAAAALSGTFGLAQSVSQQFGAGVQQQREAEAADNRGLLNAADRDLRGMPAEQAGAPGPAARAAADEPTTSADDPRAALRHAEIDYRNRSSAIVQAGDLGVEPVARRLAEANGEGDNWRAYVARGVKLNNLQVNENGSPIVRQGQELNFGDSSLYSEQQLAMQNRLGGQVIVRNTAATDFNKEQAALAFAQQQQREAGAELSREVNRGNGLVWHLSANQLVEPDRLRAGPTIERARAMGIYSGEPTAQVASVSPTYKALSSAVGMVADGLGVVAGGAMTITGAGLTATPEPTTLTKWAGVPLTIYGATFTSKSVVGFGLNATNLVTALGGASSESAYMPGSALEWAVRAGGGSPEAERVAVAADMAWGLASGRVLDARLATGAVTNPRVAALLQPALATSVNRETTVLAPQAWNFVTRIEPRAGLFDLGFKVNDNVVNPLSELPPK